MQAASFRIWTLVAEFASNKENHYTTSVSNESSLNAVKIIKKQLCSIQFFFINCISTFLGYLKSSLYKNSSGIT